MGLIATFRNNVLDVNQHLAFLLYKHYLKEDIKEVSNVMLSALGHFLDLLPAQVEPLFEAVEAHLRKGLVEL
jgi:hypothetical protein